MIELSKSNDSTSVVNEYKDIRNTALIANSPLSMSHIGGGFGPKPQNIKNYHRNIDEIELEIPIEQQKQKNKGTSKTKIYISNLNINLNNVFINMKNVSIPSTPSPTNQEGGECINIEKIVKNGLR
jgi:hypothetical protein